MEVTVLVPVFIMVICLAERSYSQVIEHPRDSVVTSGENAIFRCSINISGFVSWKLISSDGEELIITSFDPIDRVSTILFNVTVERHEGNEIVSLITFQDVENYNGTQVQCTVAATVAVFSKSPIATLRVFGHPLPLVGLNARLQENSSIIFFWSTFSPSYVPDLTYEVLVQDELTGGLLHTAVVNSSVFLYTPTDGFCSALSFSVQAFNRAGQSDTAIFIYYGLIDLELSIEVINASIHHNIRIVNEELRVDIEFKSTECPLTFCLLLREEIGNGELTIIQSAVPRFFINLKENFRYSYIVKAVINSSNISRKVERREFITTDVQEASTIIINSTNTSTVIVRCKFIPGSLSRGCHVKLMFVNMPMRTHNIWRIGDYDCFEGKIVISSDEIVSNILVFDWERDSSIGAVSIPVSSSSADLQCDSTSNSSDPKNLDDGFPYLLPVVIAVPGGILIIVLVLFIVVISCFIIINRRKKGNEGSHLNSNRNTPILNSYVPKDRLKWHTTNRSVSHQPDESYDQLSAGRHLVTPNALNRHDEYDNETMSNQNNNVYADIDEEPIYSEVGAARESHPTELYSQLGTEREYAVLESSNSALPPLPPSSPV